MQSGVGYWDINAPASDSKKHPKPTENSIIFSFAYLNVSQNQVKLMFVYNLLCNI
jgi:hypothetical protein